MRQKGNLPGRGLSASEQGANRAQATRVLRKRSRPLERVKTVEVTGGFEEKKSKPLQRIAYALILFPRFLLPVHRCARFLKRFSPLRAV